MGKSIDVNDMENEGGSSHENNLKIPSVEGEEIEEQKIDKLSVIHNKSHKSA